MDAHPMHGEIIVLAELFVGEHLLRKVAELNVKNFLVEFLSEGSHHFTKQLVFSVGTVGIDAFAQHPTLDKHEGWQEGCAVTDHRQQVTQYTSVFIGADRHVGLHPWGSGTDGEQLSAMEEIAFVQWRQLLCTRINMCLYSFHATNILKKSCR